MATAEEKRPAPVSPVLLVLLAFAGIYNLPKLASTGNNAATKGAVGIAPGPVDPGAEGPSGSIREDGRGRGELALLAPLIRLVDDGRKRPLDDAEDLFDRVAAAGYDELNAMVALIPDPDRTSNGYAFDLHLDAMERAFESWGLILDRYRYPWAKAAEKATAPAPAPAAPAGPAAVPDVPPHEQPGLLVFRSTGRKRWVFLVFLVLETPTRGLNHPGQLRQALDLVDRIEARSARPREGADLDRELERIVPILGPCFSGTRESLRLALDSWLKATPSPGAVEAGPTVAWPSRRRVRIRAGGASDTSPDTPWPAGHVADAPPDALGRARRADVVEFRATRNSQIDILWAIHQFLGGDDRRIALLAESNTGFGQGLDRYKITTTVPVRVSTGKAAPGAAAEASTDVVGPAIRATVYDFPLHISQLRREYERRGLLGDAIGQFFRSAGQLDAKSADPGDLRDLLPQQTRDLTTRHDELTLVQTLTEIGRNRYDAVGLFATNPYDALFLARMVRRFDPDVLIFTTAADLLLTQSQSIADLRGVLVGSSYPLYPHNRNWSYPHAYSISKQFFFEGAQATYNAAKLILNDTYEYGDDDSVAPLEYGMPFGTARTAVQGHWPPIWIGMVGNRGIYPIHVLDATPRSLRDRSAADGRDAGADEGPANPALEVIHAATEDVDLAHRRAWFAPWYHEFWSILYGGLLVVVHLLPLLLVLDLACRAVRDEDDRGRFGRLARRPSLDGVIRRLGWTPGETWGGEGLSYVGVVAALVVLTVFFAVSWPLLAPAPGGLSRLEAIWCPEAPPGERLDVWRLLAHEGMVVALASLLLAAVAPWWRRSPWVRTRSPAWPIAAASVLAVAVVAILVTVPALPRDAEFPADTWLLLERMVALPNGVSPLFPLLFVGAAWAAWIDAQLRRRELRQNADLPDGLPVVAELEAKGLDRSLVDPFVAIFRRLNWLRESLRLSAVSTSLVRAPVLFRVLFFGTVLLLLRAIVPTYREPSPDSPRLLWSPTFWALFLGAALLIAHQTFLLAKSWEDVQELLRNAARLPLVRAFDRLPARLGRWVFESPRPGWRVAVLREQALALKAQGDDSALRDVLDKAGIAPAQDAGWEALSRSLDGVGAAAEWPEAVLYPWLARVWTGLPATYTRCDPSPPADVEPPIAPGLAAALTDDERKRLRRWVEVAEDFLALRLLLWIGRAQAHLWVLIRAVVLGVLALLLAVNSYPFPAQGRVGSVLAALAALAAIAVLRVLVGINRDEIISRVTNTLPGRLKLDRDLLSQMLTYVVPLLGLLAALSYDVSDLLRSWFDPLFRGQM